MNAWIFTTMLGLVRVADEGTPTAENTGVLGSSRPRFEGRPGFLGSSAIPKTRRQRLDLQTHAPSGRLNLTRISSGMNLYCDGRLGSSKQAVAFLPWQGGPVATMRRSTGRLGRVGAQSKVNETRMM